MTTETEIQNGPPTQKPAESIAPSKTKEAAAIKEILEESPKSDPRALVDAYREGFKEGLEIGLKHQLREITKQSKSRSFWD